MKIVLDSYQNADQVEFVQARSIPPVIGEPPFRLQLYADTYDVIEIRINGEYKLAVKKSEFMKLLKTFK